MHKCRGSRELLTETPVKDEDSALLAPFSLGESRDQIWQWTDMAGQDSCVYVCIMHIFEKLLASGKFYIQFWRRGNN